MSYHTHHIIPRHMGGTDSPENLIKLSVAEHAEAHRNLYLEHGHWQDYVAWKALSGQITSDEIRRLKTAMAWTGRKHTPATKEKIKTARARQVTTVATRIKMSNAHKGRKITWNLNSNTPAANEKRREKLVGRPKPRVNCPHCGKNGGKPQMMRWHFENCSQKRS